MKEILETSLIIYFIYFETVIILGALIFDVRKDALIVRTFL